MEGQRVTDALWRQAGWDQTFWGQGGEQRGRDQEGGLGCCEDYGLGWSVPEWAGRNSSFTLGSQIRGTACQLPVGTHGEPLRVSEQRNEIRIGKRGTGSLRNQVSRWRSEEPLGTLPVGTGCCLQDKEGRRSFPKASGTCCQNQPDRSPAVPVQLLVSHGVWGLLTIHPPSARDKTQSNR